MKNILERLEDLSNRFWRAIGSGWFIAALVAGHFLAHSYIWWSVS